MEFINSTLDLDLAFDSSSGNSRRKSVYLSLILLFYHLADAEVQDNSLFASSNNSYVSILR